MGAPCLSGRFDVACHVTAGGGLVNRAQAGAG